MNSFGFLPILVVAIIIAVSVAQEKTKAEARRRAAMQGRPPVGRPAQPAPQAGRSTPTVQTKQAPGEGRPVAGPHRRPEHTQRGHGFEKHAEELDRDFQQTSSAADVMYTTQGCGCNASGEASAGRAHGRSNAIYDESRFYEEAQEMRKGNWT